MVTIIQDKVMPKRVPIYADDLQVYIELILHQLKKHENAIEDLVSALVPPYPIVKLEYAENKFHDSVLIHVAHSSLKQIYKDFEANKINYTQLQVCADEYQTLPSRNTGLYGDSQPGIQDTTFNDDMLDLSHSIADYLESSDVNVPHLRRAGVTSDKIVGSLAIIYTGRMLQKLKETSNEQPSD